MKIIIDSGSTKADWRIVEGQKVESLETIGLSPVLHPKDFIERTIEQAAFSKKGLAHGAKLIHYYGTGCWDASRKSIIEDALKVAFKNAGLVEVENDLFGAARATCSLESGIVAILGTGSNSCLFDGHKIVAQIENLGYLLGDEGSGGDLGKALLQAYFYRELPPILSQKLDKFFPEGKTTLLDKLYGTNRPNAYLASFTRFISEHQSHPFIQTLIENSFASFIDRHLRKYDNHQSTPVHFVGSIAYYFQEFIKKMLEDRNMKIGNIIRKPIDYLVKFHMNYE